MFCLGSQKALTLLRTFAVDLHAVHYARSQPSPTRQKALSSDQQLVRNSRQSIIEPTLALCGLSSDSSEEQQLAPDSALKNSIYATYAYVIRADGPYAPRVTCTQTLD